MDIVCSGGVRRARNEFLDANPAAEALFEAVELSVIDVSLAIAAWLRARTPPIWLSSGSLITATWSTNGSPPREPRPDLDPQRRAPSNVASVYRVRSYCVMVSSCSGGSRWNPGVKQLRRRFGILTARRTPDPGVGHRLYGGQWRFGILAARRTACVVCTDTGRLGCG